MAKEPKVPFYKKLRELLKNKLTPEDMAEVVHMARSSVGGSTAAANRKMAPSFSDMSGSVFMECQFAEPPNKINVLPKPGTYSHPAYGKIVITQERNDNFVTHFQEGVYQKRLPIDLEHETKLSGAAGWMTALAKEPDGSVSAYVEWTDRGIDAIKADRFKYFSPEWYNVWEQPISGDKYTDILIGGALCTRPFFKEPALLPLVANEEGLSVIEEIDEPEEDDEWTPEAMITEALAYSEQFDDNLVGTTIGAFLEAIIHSNFTVSADNLRKTNQLTQEARIQLSNAIGEALKTFGAVADPVTLGTTIQISAPFMYSGEVKAAELEQFAQLDPGDVHVNQMLKPCKDCGKDHMSNVACSIGGKKMATVEELEAQIATQAQQIQTLMDANTAAAQVSQTASEEAVALRTRLQTMEASERSRRFSDLAMGNGGANDGLRWYGEVDKHVSMMESLATAFGEDSEQFKSYVDMQDGNAKRLKDSGVFNEIGVSAAGQRETTGSALDDEVKTYMEAHPEASKAEATVAVLEAKPELYAEDRKAQDKRIAHLNE